MSVRVFTGLPASGKTSALILRAREKIAAGTNVELFLSAEHPELTRRPNVKPGGMMSCRNPDLFLEINHVVDTTEATRILGALEPGTLAIFDEAQFFQPMLVSHWFAAADRGVEVLVSTPSESQLQELEKYNYEASTFLVACSCGNERATQVLYGKDLTFPTHLCSSCYEEQMNNSLDSLLEDVRSSEPFPNELHTYQPFFDIDMSGWELVRDDSPQRLAIIQQAAARSAEIRALLANDVQQPSFVDLGCCSGFFADGMTSIGFRSAGVDIDENFINWGSRLATIKGQSINYTQSDLLEYLTTTTDKFDVISTFATVQWVMAQHGYEAGLTCFQRLFEMTQSVAIIEMGYTSEDIYKDKITDRPTEIDRDWVLQLMNESKRFSHIEVHPSGENGIWRDIFVGFVQTPEAAPFEVSLPLSGATQIAEGKGYFDDNWAETEFETYVQVSENVSKFRLDGWRPEPATTVHLNLSGDNTVSQKIKAGTFSLRCPLELNAGERLRISVTTDDNVPADGDERQLGFVLRSIDLS